MKNLSKIICLISISVLLVACKDNKNSRREAPIPTVTTQIITKQSAPLSVEYAARAEGYKEVEVRAQVSGILLKRNYREGSHVKKDQQLFQIDPKPYQIALQRAEAAQKNAEANLKSAQRNWKRIDSLFKKGVVSEKSQDDAISALESAEASIDQAKAEVAAAKLNLDYTSVKAPISGITSKEIVSEGSLIGTSSSESLLTKITQIDPIYASFAIPDSEFIKSRQMMENGKISSQEGHLIKAKIFLNDNITYDQIGYLNFTDPSIDTSTGTVDARAVFDNPKGDLFPGQFVRIALQGLVLNDALLVPESAIIQNPQGKFVMIVDTDFNAQIRPVKTGLKVGDSIDIEEGINDGDVVIIEGMIKAKPGQKVKIETPNTEAKVTSK